MSSLSDHSVDEEEIPPGLTREEVPPGIAGSAASSHHHADASVEPPPLPPPVEAPPLEQAGPDVPNPRRVQIRGITNRSHVYYLTEYGKVTYYDTVCKFEAVCRYPGHGDCRLARTVNAPRGRRMVTDPHQGRAAAFLVAWLEGAAPITAGVPNSHRLFRPVWQVRRSVRDRLKVAPAHARGLLEAERPQADYEADSEPSDFND